VIQHVEVDMEARIQHKASEAVLEITEMKIAKELSQNSTVRLLIFAE
jgi:hypothetical protein